MHPNIRDDAKREYVLLGPCQPKGHKYPKGKYMAAIGVFMIIGTKIVLGWNIVFLRMLPFASIVISLSLKESRTLVLNPSRQMGLLIGRMDQSYLMIMLIPLLIIRQDKIMNPIKIRYKV